MLITKELLWIRKGG